MHLSKRMRMVADMVPRSEIVADIGCDHGYLSIWLVREGVADHVIAMDLRSGPLSRAQENIRFFHQEEYVETRLSDGVEKLLVGEAETLVFAGMGGELMSGLLKKGEAQVQAAKCLVLQPQSDVTMVRTELRRQGYVIDKEDCCVEDGKYYVVMRAFHGTPVNARTSYEDIYGRYLTERRHPVYREFLEEELRKKQAMLTQLRVADTPLARERMESAEAEERRILDALRCYE